MDEMRPDKFSEAAARVLAFENRSKAGGIGTLGERSLHSVLKYYLEPDPEHHEVKVGKYRADIANEYGITEIQTRQFDKLRGKLEAFLAQDIPVTVVYPIAAQKWLCWIDEETGEVSKRRLSPRRGSPYDIFPELYRIKMFLCRDNLRIQILLIDLEEYRLLNGWSEDRKKGSHRHDRIPIGISGELTIASRWDYRKLIPETLAEPFTSRDFSKAAKISYGNAQTALNVLREVEAIRREGKDGRSYTYRRNLIWDAIPTEFDGFG